MMRPGPADPESYPLPERLRIVQDSSVIVLLVGKRWPVKGVDDNSCLKQWHRAANRIQ